jgi:hypothetical protein
VIHRLNDQGQIPSYVLGGHSRFRWDEMEAYKSIGRQNALITPMRLRLERP